MLYQKKNGKLEPLTGSTLYAETPIGTVIASFLAVAPSGYIKCDDTVYTKAAYPELYEKIPDVFKDTTNETFTIDLREVALKGIGLSSLTTEHYSSTGLTLGEFIEDRIQSHTHRIADYGAGSSTNRYVTQNQPGYTSNAFTLAVYGARTGDTTEVKSVGVNYFVKAKHVALPIDIMDAISEEYATKEEVDTKITEKTSWKVLRVFTAAGSATLPEGFEDVLVVETNTGSTITSSGRTLFFPRIAITGASGQTANYWTAGNSAGNISDAGVVTISTLSSGYVKVYYR